VAGGTPLDQDLPRLAEQTVTMYRLVADALAAAPDCATATAKLDELFPRFAAIGPASERVLHAGRAAELRKALEPHLEAFDAAGQAIAKSPRMAACASDKAFEKAFDRLVSPPR
jgi:hypothetical protein